MQFIIFVGCVRAKLHASTHANVLARVAIFYLTYTLRTLSFRKRTLDVLRVCHGSGRGRGCGHRSSCSSHAFHDGVYVDGD